MVINQFFKELTPKMRAIVFLASLEDMSFDRIRTITKSEMRQLLKMGIYAMPAEMAVIFENLLDGKEPDDRVFTTPAGRPLSVKRLDDILAKAHERNHLEYKGRAAFADMIKKTSTTKRKRIKETAE